MYKQNETQEVVARFEAGERNLSKLGRELGESASFVRGALAVYGLLETPKFAGRPPKLPKKQVRSGTPGRVPRPINAADGALLRQYIGVVGSRDTAAKELGVSRATLSRYESCRIGLPMTIAAQIGIRMQLV